MIPLFRDLSPQATEKVMQLAYGLLGKPAYKPDAVTLHHAKVRVVAGLAVLRRDLVRAGLTSDEARAALEETVTLLPVLLPKLEALDSDLF